MDGNGRWATRRGLPRTAGHLEGAKVVRKIVEASPKLGITILTLYAFSSDNWKRPADEVRTLMRLFSEYLASEKDACLREGVRLSVIGRRDRLSPELRDAVETAEAATRHGTTLHLRIAIDYSARTSLVRATHLLAGQTEPSAEELARAIGRANHCDEPTPDVDLVIRTSGEQRLSDFLLWECAYAELLFVPQPWPEFTAADLGAALVDFRSRDRRFGAVPAPAADAK